MTIRDEARIVAFCVCVMLGFALAGAISHPHDLIRDWIDRGAYAALGAAACFFIGPRRPEYRKIEEG